MYKAEGTSTNLHISDVSKIFFSADRATEEWTDRVQMNFKLLTQTDWKHRYQTEIWDSEEELVYVQWLSHGLLSPLYSTFWWQVNFYEWENKTDLYATLKPESPCWFALIKINKWLIKICQKVFGTEFWMIPPPSGIFALTFLLNCMFKVLPFL